jgi:uncharacterized protein
MTKAQVRTLSLHWKLPTWDKPATPCLASRIRYGVEVTGYRLARIDRVEIAVRALLADAGLEIVDLRVRDLGDSVRVEIAPAPPEQAAAVPGLASAVAEAGFGALPLAVEAFSCGRLNSDAAQHPSAYDRVTWSRGRSRPLHAEHFVVDL